MFDKETSDAIGAWRYGIEPTNQGCEKYDHASLSFTIPNLNLTIAGIVIWDNDAREYVFHFHEHRSPSQIFGTQRDFAMYTSDVHEYLMNTFRVQFGIFKTNGMYVIPEHSSFFFDQSNRLVC
jgi:hypothetical protein